MITAPQADEYFPILVNPLLVPEAAPIQPRPETGKTEPLLPVGTEPRDQDGARADVERNGTFPSSTERPVLDREGTCPITWRTAMAENGVNLPSSEDWWRRVRVRVTSPLSIFNLGMSLGLFLAITFIMCVLFDLVFPEWAMHQTWERLLPGFTWLTWPSFFLGLVWSFGYGWYVALIFGPLYNFFSTRAAKSNNPDA